MTLSQIHQLCDQLDQKDTALKALLSRVTWFVSFTEGQLHQALYETVLKEIDDGTSALAVGIPKP